MRSVYDIVKFKQIKKIELNVTTQDFDTDLGRSPGNFELADKQVPDPYSNVLFHLKIVMFPQVPCLLETLVISCLFCGISLSTEVKRIELFFLIS